MKIQWLAHATFLIEGNGLRIVTDPYTPHVLGFPEVQERADLVIRSSADDEGHCNAAMIQGEPVVVTATEIPPGGVEVKGIKVMAIPAQESLIYKENPGLNAMYRFALENMQIAHLGDVGNPLSADQVAALQNTDVLMVPAGGPPTISLDDLWEAIATHSTQNRDPDALPSAEGPRLRCSPSRSLRRTFLRLSLTGGQVRKSNSHGIPFPKRCEFGCSNPVSSPEA